MVKIAFLGAGSSVFAKNVLGDCLCVPGLKDAHIALVDIDPKRLADSERMMNNLNRNLSGRATVEATRDRRAALQSADFVVNAIQVGGYEPSTIIDFEVPKKYGLRQTIADTLGIGGIMRTLRTLPVLLEFAHDIEELCPDAWFLNYTNPMAMLTGGLLRATGVRAVGLCHSVQVCASHLCRMLELPDDDLRAKIAGINHQGWLLKITRHGEDLYPEIKRRAFQDEHFHKDSVRFEVMRQFGYYVTESSEHTSEYLPYFIKATHPELIERYRVPLDEYPRRCVNQIEKWRQMREELTNSVDLTHERTHECASSIMDSIIHDRPYQLGGNVINNGLITNLPSDACVEVPCLVDGNGVQGTHVGALPLQCAAVNTTNINVQLLTIEAALTHKREHIYHAALLDPHTSSELTIDEIRSLVDELMEAHGDYLPKYR